MKKFILTAVTAVALAKPALAADVKVTAPAAPEAPPNPWDVAFGGGITSDYIFRGITQSNHKPSVSAYFEPRYNVTKDLQYYVGISGESISFPNRAAAEVDVYGGFRPTFGPLALDFGLLVSGRAMLQRQHRPGVRSRLSCERVSADQRQRHQKGP